MLLNFEIHPLDSSFDRDPFNCGTEALNKFLKSHARQNQDKGISRTFVAIEADDKTKRVLGFYSQSMAQIDLTSFPGVIQKKLPRHPVPAARIGRLATDVIVKGQGLGRLLVVDALKRVKAVSGQIGVYAVIVDAKDQAAKDFYSKLGFMASVSDPMMLFYSVASISL
jgi:predicted GNAT family N-acyltransferase